MRRRSATLIAFGAASAVVALFAGCGSQEGVVIDDDASTDGLPPVVDGGNPPQPDAADSGTADGARDGAAEGGRDATVVDGSRADSAVCTPTGGACATSVDCCTANCDMATSLCAPSVGACKGPGEACATGLECCTSACNGGVCDARACVADGLSCAMNSDCCGANCQPDPLGGGKCEPLNPGCRTAGNPCAADTECCSSFCNGGVCSARPSFCTQVGDACARDTDCCTGTCTIAGGATLGVCGAVPSVPGSPNCAPAGTLCFEASTTCGGSCCSRKCAVYAPSGRSICQPASGCRPTGEICVSSADCCGSATLPDGTLSEVTCARRNPSDPVGKCDNGKRCSPAGSICKLATTSCNATDRCCSGTVQQNPLRCQQDALGVPRCLTAPIDCAGGPPPAGTACASSADCCGNPCTPSPTGGFVCGDPGSCVPVAGACTTHADCCPGTPCVFAPGSSSGACGGVVLPDGGVGPTPDSGAPGPDGGGGADGGTPPPGCALYGQSCAVAGDCCDGVPCTSGRCRTP